MFLQVNGKNTNVYFLWHALFYCCTAIIVVFGTKSFIFSATVAITLHIVLEMSNDIFASGLKGRRQFCQPEDGYFSREMNK